ncbi:TPA: hypothetical protein ACNVCI_004591, partial [Citrobacter braakii]
MALSLLAANNAQTVLAAGISSTATSLTVSTGTGTLFPSPVAGTSFFKLTIIDAATGSLTEIVHVTARAGDVFTIQRAQEGTTARAWSANDIAANMMTAGSLQLYAQKDQSLLIDNNLSEIANAGTAAVAKALANLGLGKAAKRDVGTGSNQLPDMSAFGLSRNGQTAWDILPNGMIRQVGTVTLPPVGNFNPQVLGGVTYYTHYYRVNFPRQ